MMAGCSSTALAHRWIFEAEGSSGPYTLLVQHDQMDPFAQTGISPLAVAESTTKGGEQLPQR
jgi:hypothetical protein